MLKGQPVSGHWSPRIVKRLCEDRIVLGVLQYGRTSGGNHLRLGEDGPRPLEAEDRGQPGKTRTVSNKPQVIVEGKLPFEPLIDPARWEAIQVQTQSARTTSPAPRSDEAKYPLAGRLVDQTPGCGYVLYGRSLKSHRLYICGLYSKTSGAHCHHNKVDAQAMERFTMAALGELVDRLGLCSELRERLRAKAQAERTNQATSNDEQRQALENQIAKTREQVAVAARNAASETDEELRDDIRRIYRRHKNELSELNAALSRLPPSSAETEQSIDQEVDAAMSLLDDLKGLSSKPSARSELRPLLQRLGLHIGLRFQTATRGKTQRVQELIGGVIRFGERPRPVAVSTPQENPDSPGGPDEPAGDMITCSSSETVEREYPSTSIPQGCKSFTKGNRGDREGAGGPGTTDALEPPTPPSQADPA
jgi:hypothetical protein